jgi:MFS transporter, DHA3 family, macrolide efflux protein
MPGLTIGTDREDTAELSATINGMENNRMADQPIPFLKSAGSRTFLQIWFGQLISTLGSQLTGFALSVYVYKETGSLMLFALNQTAFMLPFIIVAPFSGALVDRIDRKWAMILSDTGAGLSTLAIVILYLTGDLQIWHILIATFCNSAFNTIQWPAWSAAQTLLVPKEHLGRAGGMVQIGDALGQLAAPAIAGALYGLIGIGGIVAIDFSTFLFAVFTLLLARIPRPVLSAAGVAAKGSIFQDAQFGFKYIWARKPLLGLLTYFATLNFLSGFFGPLIGPLLLDMTSPQTLGVVMSVVGLGMLAGTLAMSAWGGPKRKVDGLFLFGGLGSFFIGLIGLRANIPMMTAAGFCMMFTMPILNACSQAIWQRKVEPDLQGRVFSARRVISWCTQIPTMLIAPLLAERIFEPLMAANGPLAGTTLGSLLTLGDGRGIGVLLILSGALGVVATFAYYAIPTIRNAESLLPDTVPDEPQAAAEDRLTVPPVEPVPA